MTIVNDYLDNTKKYKQQYGEKTIVLMQVGSFFEVYGLKTKTGEIIGSDIEHFSQINDLIIAKKSNMKPGNGMTVLMAGFGLAQLDKYVKRLQQNKYTIIIITQDIQGKNTSRSVSEIISPGTFFSLDSNCNSNITMCIWLFKSRLHKLGGGETTIGISTLDVCTGHTSIGQFQLNESIEISLYDDLERLVSLYNPSEFIFIHNIEESNVSNIIQQVGLTHSKQHIVDTTDESHMATLCKNAEKQIYISEIIRRLYTQDTAEILLETKLREYEIGMQSFVYLIDFMYQHSPHFTARLQEPKFESHPDNMILANHSLRQLNILDDYRHEGNLRSVSALLNKCCTSMGKREFHKMIANPITNIEKLTASYEITDYVLKKEKYEIIYQHLKQVRDIEKFQRKIILGKIAPKEFAFLAHDLKNIQKLWDWAQKHSFIKKYIAGNFSQENKNIHEYCQMILDNLNQTFNLEQCETLEELSVERINQLPEENLEFIKPKLSAKIDNLLKMRIEGKRKLDGIAEAFSSQVAKLEKSTKSSKKSTYVRIHTMAKSAPILLATKRRAELLKSQLKDKINILSNTLKFTFKNMKGEIETNEINIENIEYKTAGSNKKDIEITSPEIAGWIAQSYTASDKLAKEMIAFYTNYVRLFPQTYDVFLSYISKFAILLDLAHCKAKVARKYNYCKPIIDNSAEKAYFSAKNLRHPLIEHLQQRELYVTNDILLGTTDSYDGMLLYGTNAVGKTSLIRSVGIMIIMAQTGLYVPCSSLYFSPYKSIYTRILGNDDLFKGLSTFAVEMSELRTILRGADKDSLILGDELCSGTESDSALSIFTAGVETLHKRKSTFLFATHFHEIQNYSEIKALDKMCAKHMAVLYDKFKNVLVYDRKLRDGPGDAMYGLEVCKSLALHDSFLQRAHEIRSKYNKNTTKFLSAKPSHYNSKKISGDCELCGLVQASEVHHLQHQANADKNDFIKTFHKNHKANLVNICHACHDKIHSSFNQHKIVKTTCGYELAAI